MRLELFKLCREENTGNFAYREKQKNNCVSLNQIKVENNHRQEKKERYMQLDDKNRTSKQLVVHK